MKSDEDVLRTLLSAALDLPPGTQFWSCETAEIHLLRQCLDRAIAKCRELDARNTETLKTVARYEEIARHADAETRKVNALLSERGTKAARNERAHDVWLAMKAWADPRFWQAPPPP